MIIELHITNNTAKKNKKKQINPTETFVNRFSDNDYACVKNVFYCLFEYWFHWTSSRSTTKTNRKKIERFQCYANTSNSDLKKKNVFKLNYIVEKEKNGMKFTIRFHWMLSKQLIEIKVLNAYSVHFVLTSYKIQKLKRI